MILIKEMNDMAKKASSKKAAKPAKKPKAAKKSSTKAKPAPMAAKQMITKDMSFGEILQRFPQTFSVFSKYGMHCIGCSMSAYETVEQGAKAHGMKEKDLAKLLDEMNRMAAKKK